MSSEKLFYAWYTACAIVKAKSEEDIDQGKFEFVRHCDEDSTIKEKILENFEICERVQNEEY